MRAWILLVASSTASGFTPTARYERWLVATDPKREPTMIQSYLLRHHERTIGNLRMTTIDGDEVDKNEEENEQDDYDHGPLSDGVESVSWLPTVVGAKDVVDLELNKQDSEVLPLFPLGGIVYTPNSEHVLNIFEPRYRQMYSDILMNGSRRFVVSMSHPTESGRFAQMGVLFELKELKEVSEQTGDQIKYICSHKVTGRVMLNRIINPTAWESRKTYLKVEGRVIDDSGKSAQKKDEEEREKIDSVRSEEIYDKYGALENAATDGDIVKLEKSLKDSFSILVDIQHDLEEDVRFTKSSVASLATKDGPGKDGLWQTIKLWQSFADQRLMAQQNELQQEFQKRLQAFLKKDRGLKENELPSAISFDELSEELKNEVKELQKRMAMELKPLVLESTLTMQKILEAEDHPARLKLLKFFVENETKRLKTKRALKGIFSNKRNDSISEVSDTVVFPLEERLDESIKQSKPGSSLLIDEDDAFQ